MNRIRTDILEIAFEEGGPPDGIPVLCGWPDAPRGWNEVSQHLHADGYRTIAPFLGGSSPTEFLSKETPRVSAGVALAAKHRGWSPMPFSIIFKKAYSQIP